MEIPVSRDAIEPEPKGPDGGRARRKEQSPVVGCGLEPVNEGLVVPASDTGQCEEHV